MKRPCDAILSLNSRGFWILVRKVVGLPFRASGHQAMSPPLDRRWYVAKGKQRLGPFSAAQLQRLVAEGRLGPEQMVLLEGAKKWCPAGSITTLVFQQKAIHLDASAHRQSNASQDPSISPSIPLQEMQKSFSCLPPKYWFIGAVAALFLPLALVLITSLLPDNGKKAEAPPLALTVSPVSAGVTPASVVSTTPSPSTSTAGINKANKLQVPATIVDAGPSSPYQAIDYQALQAPEEAERSIPSLAAYLVRTAKNDRQKVRAIFRWMADRIAYNAEGFLAGKDFGDCSAEAVLQSRRSVCEGYANLFQKLCQQEGVEAVTLHGYSKGYSYALGEKTIKRNHAWNAVRIEGQWQLIDVTWAAGFVDGKRFVKLFDEYYFLTPPERSIFSHFPDEPKWQLLKKPVSLDDYQKWPKVDKHLLKWTVTAGTIHDAIKDKAFRGLVKAYHVPDVRFLLHKAPIRKHLKAGESYQFFVEAPGCHGMALINNREWHYLERSHRSYEAVIRPKQGKLALSALLSEKASYWTMLKYEVEE